MIETTPASLHSALTSDDFVAANKRRLRQIATWGILLAAVIGGSYIAFGIDNILIPLVLLLAVFLPILLWRFPNLALYIPFAIVCFVEVYPLEAKDSISDRIPAFINVNTIVQFLAHVEFKALPINLIEVFFILAATLSLVRSVYTNTANLRVGALIWPILIYIGFVSLGWINGVSSGGDFKISLEEVRSQFYFLLAYLIGVNMIRDMRQIRTLQWIMVICIGIKGILYTFRRYVTLHGLPLPDQGVGSHEEAFMFDMFGTLLAVLLACNINKRMKGVMWILLPLVILGNLSTNRRAATAAIIIAFPIFLMAAYQAFPSRRKFIIALSVALVASFSVYYSIFKNSSSTIAQPARAIRSQFSPDVRDALSNQYRVAEEVDLYATIKIAPVQGFGYGKRMLHAVPIADISKQYEWWDIMPHNQILWVWMRIGTVGFIIFWTMISAIIIMACRIIRRGNVDVEVKSVAIFVLLSVSMLLMFGLLDLQLSNLRDMLFVGYWTGALAALPSLRQGTSTLGERA